MKKLLMITVMGLSIGTSYCHGANGSFKDQYPEIYDMALFTAGATLTIGCLAGLIAAVGSTIKWLEEPSAKQLEKSRLEIQRDTLAALQQQNAYLKKQVEQKERELQLLSL